MRITIDVSSEFGLIETEDQSLSVKPGKWLDLLALLAILRATPGGAHTKLAASVLYQYGEWQHREQESVGKEVAARMTKASGKGGDIWSRVIEGPSKTNQWRLAPALTPADLVLLPSRSAVQTWLDGRKRVLNPAEAVPAIELLVDATIRLQKGDLDGCLAAADRVDRADAVGRAIGLDGWSVLMAGRAHQRADRPIAVAELYAGWTDRFDASGRAVEARLAALDAMARRFEAPEQAYDELRAQVVDLESRGDISSLAATLNSLGLLARRTDRIEAAVSHHARAVALFGIVGDLPSLQAALFNMALCEWLLFRSDQREGPNHAFALLDLCIRICQEFRIGDDSAQAELAGAEWSGQAGDIRRGWEYIVAAERIVALSQSPHDQACLHRARARLWLASDPPDPASAHADFTAASTAFAALNDDRAAGDMASEALLVAPGDE